VFHRQEWHSYGIKIGADKNYPRLGKIKTSLNLDFTGFENVMKHNAYIVTSHPHQTTFDDLVKNDPQGGIPNDTNRTHPQQSPH